MTSARGRAAGRRARVARRGYTLVETMIAVMLISIVVTSVFSLVVTAKVGTRKTGHRGQAIFYARQLQETLRSYVRPDTEGSAPGPNNWILPGDPCGCWALQSGSHDANAMLPAAFKASPINGALSYTVTDVACGGQTCKQVAIQISWEDYVP